MKRIYHLLLILFLIILSCDEKQPIAEDKFIMIYSNLISAPDSIAVDSLKFVEYKQKVFSEYGYSEKDYEKTVRFYNQYPEKWEEFFRKVIKHIESANDSSQNGL